METLIEANVVPTPEPGNGPVELVAEGKRFLMLFDQEGYAEAVAQYLQALAKSSGFAPAHAGLSEAYSYWGFRREIGGQESRSYYRLAFEHAEKALSLAPDRADSHRAMAVALRRGERSDPDRRREEVLAALELDPKDAHTWYERWRAFGYSLSDESIQRALEMDPRHIGAHIDLGVVLCDELRLNEALMHLMQAVQLNPRNSLAYYNLAMVLDRLDRSEQAVKALLKAQQMYRDDPLIAHAIVLLGEKGTTHA